MLQPDYYLVIVIMGGNDIGAETDVRELSVKLLEIHNTIESYAIELTHCLNSGPNESALL